MFWPKFILFAAIVIAINASIQLLVRKLLNVEKKKSFLRTHVNHLHRGIDWGIWIVTVIGTAASFYLIFSKDYSLYLYLVVLLCFNITSDIVRAFFEWKYSETPKHSILTISEMIYITIVVVVIIQFDLLSSWT
ncbi:DUF4181 domain-containing protein [Sporosarcina sp. NPDC096371]|uniref:DUF4181 domain-containing protein n=1 Tax=Sporosarcina sp. NPDC096371 TaxID=3364530 RepID=UPI0037F24520